MDSKKGLSEVQEVLIQLLKEAGLDETWIICILLMLKDDEMGQMELLRYLHYMKPTAEEITQNWVKKYLETNPQTIFVTTSEEMEEE